MPRLGMVWLQLLIGFALLVLGGELLVRGAVGVAARLGLSPILIGLTLVGFGTSTPELTTSLEAALAGAPGIAVGNVVGSNIANILLILGLAAVVTPLRCLPAAFRRDGAVLMLSALACAVAILSDSLTRAVGLAFLGALAGFVILTYRLERGEGSASAAMHSEEAKVVRAAPRALWQGLLLTAAGIAGTVGGAGFLVDGAVGLARGLGVSESIIGLTLVAVGTSLPELATTLAAALRGQADVAVGNVVGSNIFNALGILGATAVVQPIEVPADLAGADVWIMLAVSAALIVAAVSGWRISRGEGALMLLGYGGYMVWLAGGAAG